MKRLLLIHWKPEEAAARAVQLEKLGYTVDHPDAMPKIGEVGRNPPDAFIIDLSKLPSHGREVATAFRGSKRTSAVPIVFLDGDPAKVEAIRALLPDAAYGSWDKAKSVIARALRNPPSAPVVPTPMMDRYGGRTVAQKLGLCEGATLLVIDPPRDYATFLEPLPDRASLSEDVSTPADVNLWFVRDPDQLTTALERARPLLAKGKFWIAWPKKTADPASLIDEQTIRDFAINSGLVDYKVCAVSARWSGLAIAARKKS